MHWSNFMERLASNLSTCQTCRGSLRRGPGIGGQVTSTGWRRPQTRSVAVSLHGGGPVRGKPPAQAEISQTAEVHTSGCAEKAAWVRGVRFLLSSIPSFPCEPRDNRYQDGLGHVRELAVILMHLALQRRLEEIELMSCGVQGELCQAGRTVGENFLSRKPEPQLLTHTTQPLPAARRSSSGTSESGTLGTDCLGNME